MKARRTSLAVVTALLAIALIVGFAYAYYSTSVIYTTFNNTTATFEKLDKDYESITAYIIDHLTYNTTTSSPYAVVGFVNASTGTIGGYNIRFNGGSSFDVLYVDGANNVLLAQHTLANPNDTVVFKIANYHVTIEVWKGGKSSDKTVVLQGFSNKFTISYLQFFGKQYACTNGYMQVDVGYYGSGASGSAGVIMEWLPTIIVIAMFGVVVGMLGRVAGKW